MSNYTWMTVRPRRGDNIYSIVATISAMAKAIELPKDALDPFKDEVSAAGSYDEACAVCDRWFDCQWEGDDE